jgi:DNA-binding MarR family transcriptional regulator
MAKRRTRDPASEGQHPHVQDSVDVILQEWRGQHLDLDFSPIGVITRLYRLRAHLDTRLSEVFREHGLTNSDFAVLVTLRRAGEPYRMSQTALMADLQLTSGTISVRIDRLQRAGLVRRDSDPADGRGVLATLTAEGLNTFDAVAPAHLANEERLLSALSPEDRQVLADLLRRLLLSFEQPISEVEQEFGMTLAPAHEARRARLEVGLRDRVGLLVTNVTASGPAAAAGLRRGDLVVGVDGHPVRCLTDIAGALAGGAGVDVEYVRGERLRSVRLAVLAASGPERAKS